MAMMRRTPKDDVRPVKCAGCHLPAHAYGTADPNNDYDANACVKGLLAENTRLRAENADLRESRELAWRILAES